MSVVTKPNRAELTHTLPEFVSIGINSDDQTYYNFSIFDKINDIYLLDWNVIDEYLYILENMSVNCDLTDRELSIYKYQPDLLAYDLYKSIQLDFIILKINDMASYREFDRKRIKLPYASKLRAFLTAVYNTELGYLNQNRIDVGLYVR